MDASISVKPVRHILRLFLKYASIAIAAILLMGIILPFISVGHYGRQIKAALEAALGRRVEIGRVHYTLFSGPGFSIDDVTIAEDPRYGLEPCAFVSTLEARVRLDKLLLGRIEFAGLRLDDPTLNLVKRTDGTWNVVELINRMGRSNFAPLGFLPAIEVSGARLNFKFGNRKSIFYIDNSDVAVYAEQSGKLRIQFAGFPSRSDRAGRGFGSFHGSANWYVKASGPDGDQLEGDVSLDQSNLSELMTLVEGYDIGVHGEVSSHALISGPATALKITGDLRLEDVHRWDLLPASGESWRVRYTGDIDLVRHSFSLQTISGETESVPPIGLRVHVNDFLTQPSWAVVAQFNKAPVQKVLPFSRRMGVSLPDGLNLTGSLDGAVGYSNQNGWNGGVAFSGITAALSDLPPLEVAIATASITNQHIHFDPAEIQPGFGGTLNVSGDYFADTRKVAVSITVADTRIELLKNTLSSWLGAVPIISQFDRGQLSGRIEYSHDAPDDPKWSGQFQLARASLQPPGLALPLTQFGAHVAFTNQQADVTRLTAHIGGTLITGDYHYNGLAQQTERIHLQIPSADLLEVEKELEPSLAPQGFLARLRFGRRSLPAWIAERNLEGEFAIDKLSVNDVELGSLHSKLLWQGSNIQLTSLKLTLPDGSVDGRGTVSLANNSPKYHLTVSLTDYPWKGGLLNANGAIEAAGTGSDLFAKARASGTFEAENLALSPDVQFSTLNGLYELRLDAGWPQLAITKVQAEHGDEIWLGSGRTQQDGTLLIDLANGSRQMHVVSTLSFLPARGAPLSTTAKE